MEDKAEPRSKEKKLCKEDMYVCPLNRDIYIYIYIGQGKGGGGRQKNSLH